MKYHNTHFLQLSRKIFTDDYKDLSMNAKWLFVILNELEQRFTNDNVDFFTRTDEQLANDCKVSLKTLKRAKAELKKTNLIKTGVCFFTGKDGKKSKVHYTFYRILV